MLVFGATSFVAGPLYERLGGRRVILAGAVCLPIGMLLLSLVQASSGYAALMPGLVVLGLGTGLFYSAATTTAISSLDESRSGLASGILYMLQVAGGSVGLGIATAIVTGAGFVDGLQDALRVSAALAAAGLAIVVLFVRAPEAGAEPAPAPQG
jgi:MFS family permease